MEKPVIMALPLFPALPSAGDRVVRYSFAVLMGKGRRNMAPNLSDRQGLALAQVDNTFFQGIAQTLKESILCCHAQTLTRRTGSNDTARLKDMPAQILNDRICGGMAPNPSAFRRCRLK
jgi:hypothetical protein